MSRVENLVAAEARPALQDLADAYQEVARAQRRLRGRDAMKSGTVSAPQLNLLLPLAETARMSSGQLAEAAGLTPATTTHMLDQLAAAGIVERERSETDRRVVYSKLTEHGAKVLEERRRQMIAAWDDQLSDLDDEELAIAAKVLRRITKFTDQL